MSFTPLSVSTISAANHTQVQFPAKMIFDEALNRKNSFCGSRRVSALV
jgi:hypothetical protein